MNPNLIDVQSGELPKGHNSKYHDVRKAANALEPGQWFEWTDPPRGPHSAIQLWECYKNGVRARNAQGKTYLYRIAQEPAHA